MRRNLENGTGEAWAPRWAAPFESAFNLLQKYVWANALDTPELRERLLVAKRSGIARLRSLDLLCGEWIDQTHLPASLEAAVRDGLLGAHAKRWGRLIASDVRLRYCRQCAQIGYHSVFHQIDGLRRCPIHAQRCLDSCERCGAPTPALRLDSPMLVSPFRCPHCQEPLASTLGPSRWSYGPSDKARFTRALAPVADWLRRLSKFKAPDEGLGAPLSQLSLRGAYACEGERHVGFQVARHITPLVVDEDASDQLRRPLRLVRVRTRATDHRMTYTGAPYLRRSVAKSIRRHILKAYIREHGPCIEKALQARDIVLEDTSHGGLVLQNALPCPVAGAYLRWFRLYERWGPFRFDLTVHQHTFLSSPPPENDASLALWAWRVLANFYSSAATALQIELSATAVSRGELTRGQQTQDLAGYCYENSQHACWIAEREASDGCDSEFVVVLGHEEILKVLRETVGSACLRRRRPMQA